MISTKTNHQQKENSMETQKANNVAQVKATKTPKAVTPKKAEPKVLTKGLYQWGSGEFNQKFPEVEAMTKRLDKEGYGFFRVEITCSPKSKPGQKLVNISKHSAPDTWSK